jgi:NAD(P)H-hydrate repair Nnr-like enzyme with NAD(P)H-hydrate epimerase domain
LLESTEGLIGLVGGTGGAGGLAYAIAQMLARRNERRELEEIKADRDKGWDEAMALAKKIRPEDAERKA